MSGYDDLIGTIPEIVNEAIMAEMRFYGYYPDGHGGYQGMGGLGGAPPPIAGPPTRATMGLGEAAMRWNRPPICSASRLFASVPPCAILRM